MHASAVIKMLKQLCPSRDTHGSDEDKTVLVLQLHCRFLVAWLHVNGSDNLEGDGVSPLYEKVEIMHGCSRDAKVN